MEYILEDIPEPESIAVATPEPVRMAAINAPIAATRSRAWQHLLLIGLLGWLLTSDAYHGAVNPYSPIAGMDFGNFYRAAEMLNHGQPLYVMNASVPGGVGYMYPPLLAYLMRPLALLPPAGALEMWFLISATAVFLSIAVYAMTAPIMLEEVAALSVLMIVSFRFWPMVFNFALGQTNTPLLLCACLMFWAESRGRDRLSGCMIAVGALLKPWMIGLLIYPMMRRNWRAAVWACVICVIALIAMFAPLGWHAWLDFLHVLAANAAQPWLVSQSIAGFARLHFAENSHVHPLMDSKAAFYGFIVAGYSIVGFTFLYLWNCRKPLSSFEGRLWFGLAVLSLPLVSPLCHDEYYILALPLLWALLTRPAVGPRAIQPRISLAALILYCLFTRPWPVSGTGIAKHQEGLGSLLASAYFILAALLWLVGVIEVIRARATATNIAQASAAESEICP